MSKNTAYAVVRGRQPGVYRTWPEAQAQVAGFSQPVYRGFATDAQARAWFASGGGPVPPPAAARGGFSGGFSGGGGAVAAPSNRAGAASRGYHTAHASGAQVSVASRIAGAGTYERLAGSSAGVSLDACCVLRFDGGARGNPGAAGSGAVLFSPGGERVLHTCRSFAPHATNNEAEWGALLLGLSAARALGVSSLLVEGDSSLVVNQLTGRYEVRAGNLAPLHARAMAALRAPGVWAYVGVRHIRREDNSLADAEANAAMDARAAGTWSAPAEELARAGVGVGMAARGGADGGRGGAGGGGGGGWGGRGSGTVGSGGGGGGGGPGSGSTAAAALAGSKRPRTSEPAASASAVGADTGPDVIDCCSSDEGGDGPPAKLSR